MRPIDFGTVAESVKKTGRLVMVEEGYPQCGIGAEIVSRICEHCTTISTCPGTIAAKDTPIPFSNVLEQVTLPSVQRIVDTVLAARKWS